jgi:hypothetical protein
MDTLKQTFNYMDLHNQAIYIDLLKNITHIEEQIAVITENLSNIDQRTKAYRYNIDMINLQSESNKQIYQSAIALDIITSSDIGELHIKTLNDFNTYNDNDIVIDLTGRIIYHMEEIIQIDVTLSERYISRKNELEERHAQLYKEHLEFSSLQLNQYMTNVINDEHRNKDCDHEHRNKDCDHEHRRRNSDYDDAQNDHSDGDFVAKRKCFMNE